MRCEGKRDNNRWMLMEGIVIPLNLEIMDAQRMEILASIVIGLLSDCTPTRREIAFIQNREWRPLLFPENPMFGF